MDKPNQHRRHDARLADAHRSLILPEELMSLVQNHEHHQYHCYRWRSLRFLTYHPGLSQLMQALAAESRHRLGALAEAMAGLSVAERPLASWIQSGRPPHFFIVDDDMARLEMARTLLEEGRSRRFYARLRQASVVPGLDALLDAFIMQSRAHCQLLDETRQQLPACHRPLGSVPPGRGAARRRRRRHP